MIALEYDRTLSPENRQRLVELGWSDEQIAEFGCNDSFALHGYSGNIRNANFRDPIEMHSIAMTEPAEIAVFRQKAPDVQVVDGVPVAKNRHQKLQALRAAGFEEKS